MNYSYNISVIKHHILYNLNIPQQLWTRRRWIFSLIPYKLTNKQLKICLQKKKKDMLAKKKYMDALD